MQVNKRWLLGLPAVLLLGAVAGCDTWSASSHPVAVTVSDPVRAFVARWPVEQKREFFTTIVAVGHRVTASGFFESTGPNDYRMSACNENSMILFDARHNWAGTHVLRSMPGLDTGIVEQIVRDMSLGWRMPEKFDRMRTEGKQTQVQDMTADGFKATYTFGGSPLVLQKAQFSLGLLDTLTITYKSYDKRGWVKDLSIQRPARFYSIELSFTDEPQ